MQRIFHTPEGVRDIYGEECSRKKRLQRELHQVFSRYGYEDIETPGFEYFEVFSNEVGTIPSKDLYKFFDREGNTLVLRPDFTPSVSRACATYFDPEKGPVRLCYTGNTFINNSSYRGQMKESTQMGVEHMGDDSAAADAEILAMTVECLKAAGLTEFQVSVGQVDYYKSLLAEADLEPEMEEHLRELISQKNYFGVEELVKNKNMDKSLARVLSQLPQMFGSTEVLEKAKSLMAEAGYEDGFPVDIWVDNTTIEMQGAEFFKQQMAQINIDVNVVPMESTTIADMTSLPEEENEVQIWYVNWSSGSYEADGSMRNILHGEKFPPSGYNTAFWNNAEFNKLLDDALLSADTEEIADLYAQAQAIAWEECPWVFLGNDNSIMAQRSYVKGITYKPGGDVVLTTAELEQ